MDVYTCKFVLDFQHGLIFSQWKDSFRAAAKGHLYILKHSSQFHLIPFSDALRYIAVPVSYFLGCPNATLTDIAAANGHLEVVQWLYGVHHI